LWEPLVTGLTTGAKMGFSPANGNASVKANLLVFCNAVENFSTWNGSTGSIASVTANTIVLNETALTEGFTTTGDALINGTEYAYTGITSKTLTGVTPDPTVQGPAVNTGVAQKPDTTTHSALDKGNVLLTTQGKLFMSGIPERSLSLLTYSATNAVTDFTSVPGGLGDAGDFDFMEGGGPIRSLSAYGKNGVIVHKEDAVISYSRTLAGDGTSVNEIVAVLADAEDSGATNLKGVSSLNGDSYYISGTEGLKMFSKIIEGDNVQLNSITSAILPTIQDWDFEDSPVIYYPKNRSIVLSAKNSDEDRRQITLSLNTGDISIDDDPVADYALIDGVLYFGSSLNQNVYKVGARKSAYGVGINHRYTTKSFIHSEPAKLKEINTIFVEGLIAESTKVKVTIAYGSFGIDGSVEKILEWNDTDYVATQKISALGVDVIGEVSLGASSAKIEDSYPFSVPIHVDASTKSLKYKITVETVYDDETEPNGEVYWAIANISRNPMLLDIPMSKMVNTN